MLVLYGQYSVKLGLSHQESCEAMTVQLRTEVTTEAAWAMHCLGILNKGGGCTLRGGASSARLHEGT